MANVNKLWKAIWKRLRWLWLLALLLLLASLIDWHWDKTVTQSEKEFAARKKELEEKFKRGERLQQ